MDNTKALPKLLDTIQAIPKDQIIATSIPIDIFLQEAENLALWSCDDIDQLSTVGVTHKVIDDLKLRINACREAQTHWIKIKKITPDVQKQWKEQADIGWALQDELIRYFHFAFRHDKALMETLKRYKRENVLVNMFMNLVSLAQLGNKNKELLLSVNMDLEKLTTAEQLAQELRELWSLSKLSRTDKHNHKILRDKAYTYLKQLVDEIRSCGKFLFHDNPERLQGYKVDYFIQKRAANNGK